MMSIQKTVRDAYDQLLQAPRHVIGPGRLPAALTHVPGVYIIRTPGGRVVHVGRSISIRRRILDHAGVGNNSSFVQNWLKYDGRKMADGFSVQFLKIDDAKTRAYVEALTVGLLCPLNIGST